MSPVGILVGLFNLFRWLLRSLRITGSEKASARDVAPGLLMERTAPVAIDGRVDADGAVFVSYSRSEALLVDDVVRGLEADGQRVFVDYRSLEPGRPWSDQLDAAMTTSPVIVVVVSDRAVWESANVHKEWREASGPWAADRAHDRRARPAPAGARRPTVGGLAAWTVLSACG